MALKLTHEQRENYLFVRMDGEWTEQDIRQAIDDIAELAQTRARTRVLIDALNVSAPKTEFNRYLAGEHIAEMWRRLQVAVAYPGEFITGFTEVTATNRGAHMAVFSDLASAESWLMRETAQPLRMTR